MKKLATIVTMFLFASVASAQTQGSMTANLKKVEQGKNINFNITVKPAPGLQGMIYVYAKPTASSGGENGGNQAIGPDQSSVQVAFTVPVDGAKGKWTVTRVVYRASAPDSVDKNLNLADMPSFEVVDHKAVEPDSAVIEVVNR